MTISGSTDSDAAEVTRRLEALPPLPSHLRWATTVSVGCFLDGFTTLVVASALTVLVGTLHIAYAQTGILISAAFIGMFFGAIIFGAASERFGRRTIFVATVMLFGTLSVAAAFAWDFASLFWLRVVQGLGLGGAVPVGAALIVECLPASARGRTFSLNFSILFALGFVVAPLMGFLLISLLGPELGWRALFAAGGLAVPYGIFAWCALPESPRWLASRGHYKAAFAVVDRLEEEAKRNGLTLSVEGAGPPPSGKGTRLSEAFGKAYYKRTLLVWTLFLTVSFVQYGFNAWLPTLFVKLGGLPPQYALALTVVNGCVIVGVTLLFALTVDRVGRKTWIQIGYALSLVGILIGMVCVSVLHITTWPVLFFAALFMTTGSGVNAGAIYLYGLELFPTRMRAWATSTGSSLSRAGSIFAPILIGALLQRGFGLIGVLLLLGIACLVGLTVMSLFGIETRRRALEELAV